jgi:phosphohistidine phosphatase
VYLYLVRHAVAHKRAPERWPDDGKRPLTPGGEEEFRGAARGLAEIIPEVEVLLSSPYERAWQTAEILT